MPNLLDTGPIPTLYVFKQDGCDHCKEATIHLRRLRKEHPLAVIVIDLYVNRKDWVIYGFSPKATPAYALTIGDDLVLKHTGLLEYDALVEWLRKAIEL